MAQPGGRLELQHVISLRSRFPRAVAEESCKSCTSLRVRRATVTSGIGSSGSEASTG